MQSQKIFILTAVVAIVINGGSSSGAPFSDGFEMAILDPFWASTATNATVAFSTTRLHTGLQSLELATSGVFANKGAQVSHPFPSPVYGTASIWVFDSAADDFSGNYIEFYVSNSILGQRAGLFTQDYDLGPTNGGIYYYDAFTVGSTASSVDRTKDWHLFEIVSLPTELKLSIDGSVVYAGPAGASFDGIALAVHAPSFRPGLAVQFDDFLFTPTLVGDVTGDCLVNIFDINLVSSHWGETGPAGDANGDMTVNIFDVNVISANWGASGGGAAVPEPSSLVLAALAVVGLVPRVCRTRRK